jgi:AcrR family transcriptional regulator
MEQLASAGGVTKPILYRHFGDRDGLIGQIGSHFGERLLGAIGEGLGADADPQVLIRATVDAYIRFIEDDPELYAFLLSQVARVKGGEEEIGGLINSIARQVAVVIGDGLRAGGLDAGGAEPWAYGIVGMVHQAGDWWLGSRTMSRDALVNYLTNMIWNGFNGLGPQVPPSN